MKVAVAQKIRFCNLVGVITESDVIVVQNSISGKLRPPEIEVRNQTVFFDDVGNLLLPDSLFPFRENIQHRLS